MTLQTAYYMYYYFRLSLTNTSITTYKYHYETAVLLRAVQLYSGLGTARRQGVDLARLRTKGTTKFSFLTCITGTLEEHSYLKVLNLSM